MPRIKPIDRNTADPATVELLNSVKRSMEAAPNLIARMAHSPSVARAYLGFAQALPSAARSSRTAASWPMRTWNGSAAPATLTARWARSWPTWR